MAGRKPIFDQTNRG